jgi:pimeloyl-ACP methyl ester carboxylesterase
MRLIHYLAMRHLALLAFAGALAAQPAAYPIEEGFVDSGGVLISAVPAAAVAPQPAGLHRRARLRRQSLRLGRINLLGHSFGGVPAQAYALKYQRNLGTLVLCSTFSSTSKMNEVFRKQLAAMDPEMRKRIETLEKAGLYGKGKGYERGRYPADYMTAAWGEAYFPYLYQ